MSRLEKLLLRIGVFDYLSSIGRLEIKIENCSYYYHWNGQYLSHSESESQVSESGIWRAHKLDREAEYTIPDKEARSDLSREFVSSHEEVQDHEEY